MKDITLIGIDLAKNVFQVCMENSNGETIANRKYKRAAFKKFIERTKPCKVAMEACSSSHHWAREFKQRGFDVIMINPRHVKAYAVNNKNDAKDAEAICEAAKSKRIKPIPIKTIAQQDIRAIHKSRSIMLRQKTQLANHMRSQLAEYGIVTRRGNAALKELVSACLDGEHNLSSDVLLVLTNLYEVWRNLEKQVELYKKRLVAMASKCEEAKKLMTMPGVGPMIATAFVAKIGDYSSFRKGRDLSAWLGLTPKESSSGEKHKLGGITKRGDRYLRTLLIHGGRSILNVVSKMEKPQTAYHRWVASLLARKGRNKAAVALANKHARMIWAMMFHERELDLDDALRFHSTEA